MYGEKIEDVYLKVILFDITALLAILIVGKALYPHFIRPGTEGN